MAISLMPAAFFSDEMNNVPEKEAQRLEGLLDSTYLFSYAFFMFFR
jgi:hypothetical protein